MGETFSIVPTSAISGTGIPDLLLLLVQWTQKTMVEKLTYSNEMQVKVVEGHGTTIDVVLIKGVLHEGDQIVVCGMQGLIVTSIRALLTPHSMKELRVKGTYLHHKEIKAAMGIKITAQGLEHAIAGTGLYFVGTDDDIEDAKKVAMEDMKSIMSRIDKSGEGVYVQASTFGSLEALLEFLKSPAVNIPISGLGIGPVHKKDVMKGSVMLQKKKEYATILAFDVKVTTEARELADELGVKIFTLISYITYLINLKPILIISRRKRRRKLLLMQSFRVFLRLYQTAFSTRRIQLYWGLMSSEDLPRLGLQFVLERISLILDEFHRLKITINLWILQRKGRRLQLRKSATAGNNWQPPMTEFSNLLWQSVKSIGGLQRQENWSDPSRLENWNSNILWLSGVSMIFNIVGSNSEEQQKMSLFVSLF